tara:strand:- start:1331 stop:1918 length:588 start_codon:yes stop_codon:yes gene_type:complete
MTANFLLDRFVRKGLTLLKKVQYDKNKSDSIPIEIYKTRCLGYIERVNELRYCSPEDIKYAKQKLFNVYFYLQSVSGPERQNPHNNEISIEIVEHALNQAVTESHLKHSGGLGYSVTRGLTLSEEKGEPINHYFRKVKRSPVIQINEAIDVKYKQTMQGWRNEMAKQKREVLDAHKVSRLQPQRGNTVKPIPFMR